MGNSPLLCCLDCSESKSESRSSKETKTTVTVRPTSENSLELGICKSVPFDVGSTKSSTKYYEELDENIAPELEKIAKYNSVGNFCAVNNGKRDSDFLKTPGNRFLKNFGPQSGGFIGWDRGRGRTGAGPSKPGTFLDQKELSAGLSLGKRETTKISEWDDMYIGEIQVNNSHFSLTRVSGDFSECRMSLNSECTMNNPQIEETTIITGPEMAVCPGKVLAMVSKKGGPAFQLINLGSSPRKVVDTFLKVETGSSLPVSIDLPTDTRPKLLSAKKMNMTLSENLKGYLDEATQGLMIFTGPVNGKLCYKMKVCDLQKLQIHIATSKKRDQNID